jgi:hypothetical protein
VAERADQVALERGKAVELGRPQHIAGGGEQNERPPALAGQYGRSGPSFYLIRPEAM